MENRKDLAICFRYFQGSMRASHLVVVEIFFGVSKAVEFKIGEKNAREPSYSWIML